MPSQSIGLALLLCPMTVLIRPKFCEYMNSQMMPTSASDSITGRNRMLWYIRLPRMPRSIRTAKSMPSGVAMTTKTASQMRLCRTAGQNSG